MPSAPGADVSASVRAYLARRPQKREYSVRKSMTNKVRQGVVTGSND
jgi:uncharacterized membrane-anchored protein